MSMDKPMLSGDPMSGLVASAVEYMIDAGQRSVLFLDILRRRGDQYQEHIAQTAPHVLQYAAELIIDGRKLELVRTNQLAPNRFAPIRSV